MREAPSKQKTLFDGPKQEVCGLKWSTDGEYFASGSNDNSMMVFSPKTQFPIFKKKHKAAVKAIAWSKKQPGLLASGGGTADCRIRLWSINKQCLVNEVNTGSQVCSVSFSKYENEIISTHGFSKNEVVIWKTPKLKKIVGLLGHSSRVLYQAQSPCGNYIVTGAGDETLRFWDLGYNKGGLGKSMLTGEIGLFGGSQQNKSNKKKGIKNKSGVLQLPVLR